MHIVKIGSFLCYCQSQLRIWFSEVSWAGRSLWICCHSFHQLSISVRTSPSLAWQWLCLETWRHLGPCPDPLLCRMDTIQSPPGGVFMSYLNKRKGNLWRTKITLIPHSLLEPSWPWRTRSKGLTFQHLYPHYYRPQSMGTEHTEGQVQHSGAFNYGVIFRQSLNRNKTLFKNVLFRYIFKWALLTGNKSELVNSEKFIKV